MSQEYSIREGRETSLSCISLLTSVHRVCPPEKVVPKAVDPLALRTVEDALATMVIRDLDTGTAMTLDMASGLMVSVRGVSMCMRGVEGPYVCVCVCVYVCMNVCMCVCVAVCRGGWVHLVVSKHQRVDSYALHFFVSLGNGGTILVL